MAMAHTQTEHTMSPSMVNLTIQWACQNRPKIERSDEVSGSACCATSAGFMAYPLGYPAPSAYRAALGRQTKGHAATRLCALLSCRFSRNLSRAAGGPLRNPVKFDQTRAPDRSFRPLTRSILVKVGLPAVPLQCRMRLRHAR